MRAVADTITISSSGAMERLGAGFARHLAAGDCIGLAGNLGAGKTTFARGLIREAMRLAGMGAMHIPGPGFTLVQEYPFPAADDPHRLIRHVDLWRIGDGGGDAIAELGLWDDFDSHIHIIEWPEKTALPPGHLHIGIVMENGGSRCLHFNAEDDAWRARLETILKDTDA